MYLKLKFSSEVVHLQRSKNTLLNYITFAEWTELRKTK